MLTLRTKKITRQCFVPGCRNINTVMVFRGRDPWAKVVICPDCAKELYKNLFPAEEPENTPEAEKESGAEGTPEAEKESEAEEAPETAPEEETEAECIPEEEKKPAPQAKPRQRKSAQKKDETK